MFCRSRIKKSMSAIVGYLTSGTPTKGDVFLTRQLVLVKSFSIVCLTILTIFISLNFNTGQYLMVFAEMICFILIAAALWLISQQGNLTIAINILVSVMFGFLVLLPYVQDNQSFAVIWTFFFPLFVVLLKGPKQGLLLVLAYYAVQIPSAWLGIDHWQGGTWDEKSFYRYCAASAVMVYCSYFNELSLKKAYQALLNSQENERKIANEHANTMIRILDKRNSMLSEISHELRTPLSVIKLHLEMLEDELMDDKHKTYQLLHGKLGEIDKLISGLHQITIADMGDLYIKKVPTYIYSTLQHSIDAYEALVKNHNLTLHAKLDIPIKLQLAMDEERIMQVIANIFQNSMRYTDAGGKIQFTAQHNEKQVLFTIEDSAPGVPEEALSQLCDRLYRVEESRNRATGGAGIGLSICRSIVKAHEGSIAVAHSKLGGVAITVSLPKK